jgi:hypothetical protein
MKHFKILMLLAVGLLVAAQNQEENIEYDYNYDQTPGQLFPKPQFLIQTDTQHYLNARDFSFKYTKNSFVCDLLTNAFNRYYKIIFTPNEYETARYVKRLKRKTTSNNSTQARSYLKRVLVNVARPCEDYPSLESDESCLMQFYLHFN